ncbi:class I SAM-dependent methyltransferase [Defluviimonas sp. SAOS-178_SWC]|uniref:class I SAM-dependent methyltransferase n=1 Tax=Defluviimonas sp. SAOS-178_SWC TaxID=3121287 RepID=UPI003221886A
MTHPRLSLALQGADHLPVSGSILVLGPGGATDLSDLPQDRAVIVQGFRPDHDALVAQGWTVVPQIAGTPDGFSAAIIFVPRARGAARAMVAEAAARVVAGGPVWIDGQKTDGIDTMLKDIRARAAVSAPVAKAHGKIFRFDAGPRFDDWRATDLHPAPGFVTTPGVFSAEKVDHGSALLAEALPDRLPPRVADLGAGWGWLAAQVLARPGVEEVHLIEADRAALDCARRNITDPRARFHWEDATRFRPEASVDAVVMNPPFHTGRAAEPALGAAFIAAAAAMLVPSGRLWMVANRHLPYEAVLARHFREVAEIGGDGGFKLLTAARPVAAPRPRH